MWCVRMDILDHYKKVLIIRLGLRPTDAGLVACVVSALNQIQHCEKNNWLPVVNYDAKDGLFYDPKVGPNIWDYYFLPPAGDYTFQDIQKRVQDPRDPLSNDALLELPAKQICHLYHNDPNRLATWPHGCDRDVSSNQLGKWWHQKREIGRHYVTKYIRINPHIIEQVDKFFAKNMQGYQVLGIHMRGTDFEYAPAAAPGEYIKNIEEYLVKYPRAKLFVATDQEQYLEFLKERYPDRVLYNDCIRSSGELPPCKIRTNNPAKRGEEVLIDCLLLSRCNYLLKCAAALGEFAMYLNPHLRCTDVSLGIRVAYGLPFDSRFNKKLPNLAAWKYIGQKRMASNNPNNLRLHITLFLKYYSYGHILDLIKRCWRFLCRTIPV